MSSGSDKPLPQVTYGRSSSLLSPTVANNLNWESIVLLVLWSRGSSREVRLGSSYPLGGSKIKWTWYWVGVQLNPFCTNVLLDRWVSTRQSVMVFKVDWTNGLVWSPLKLLRMRKQAVVHLIYRFLICSTSCWVFIAPGFQKACFKEVCARLGMQFCSADIVATDLVECN